MEKIKVLHIVPNMQAGGLETLLMNIMRNIDRDKIQFDFLVHYKERKFYDDEIGQLGGTIYRFSVREDSGLDLITKYKWDCKVPPIQILDPTMLLSKEDYINLSSDYENQLDGELFYYILDMTEDKKKVLEQISIDLGYKSFTVIGKEGKWYDDAKDRIVPPMELWIQAFNNAKYVFTDSFHGCVFSIIFNKDFIIYGNEGRGMSRFKSLLNVFDLKERFIASSVDYNKERLLNSIDYDKVHLIKNKELIKVKTFLDKLVSISKSRTD